MDTLAFGLFEANEQRMNSFSFSYPVVALSWNYYMQRQKDSVVLATERVFSLFSLDFYLLAVSIIISLLVLSKYRVSRTK